MGRPKGSKNKTATVAPTETPSAELSSPSKKVTSDIGEGHINPPGSDDAREAAYGNFEAQKTEYEGDIDGMSEYNIDKLETAVADTPIVETPEDEAASRDEVISDPITQDDLDETKLTETAPEEVETDEVKSEETKEDKTVPYDALHEEREKRKFQKQKSDELESKNSELQEQLSEVLQELKKKSTTDDEFASNEDKKFSKIKAEVDELKMERAKDAEKDKERASQNAQTEFEKNISDTAKSLADEGYPGFEFMSTQVGNEILKLIEEDSDNAYLQNPEGWKTIYKQRVFPNISKIFTDQKKNEVMNGKKDAKREASLVTSPGSADKKPIESKTDDDWSYEDYIADRNAKSL